MNLNDTEKKIVIENIQESAEEVRGSEKIRDPLFKKRNTFGRPEDKKNWKHFFDVVGLMPKSTKKLKVLDVGIGSGLLSCSLHKMYGYDIYATELPGILKLKKNHKVFNNILKENDVILKAVDVTKDKLPFDNGFFDVVIFTEIMEHIPQGYYSGIFGEIHRVLTKEGVLVVSTPNFLSLVKRVKFLLGLSPEFDLNSEPKFNGGTFMHLREYTKEELVTILKSNKFKIEKVKMSNLFYGIKSLDYLQEIVSLFSDNMKNIIIVKAKKA